MKENKITFMAYTDASSYNNGRRNPNQPEHSCSAGLVSIDSYVVYSFHNYNPNTSISYGELFAIHTLLSEFVPLLKGTKCKLILHTDSEYSFKSINIWYKNWKKNAKRGVWYSSTGPVSYQNMLEEILEMVDNKQIIIKHISGGHIDILNEDNVSEKKWLKRLMRQLYAVMDTCKTRYLRNNNQRITDEEAERHIFWNNICDQMAKEGLYRGMKGVKSCERKRKSFKQFIS